MAIMKYMLKTMMRLPCCIMDLATGIAARSCSRWLAGLGVTAYLALAGQAADFTTECWRVTEIPLTSAVGYADPFQNVDVTATFTGPGGVVIVRPAFWDGGSAWRVRFAPTVAGEWNMVTSCTDPSNTGLHGITHTVQCNAYTGTHAIYQHGFLKATPNGHYFVHADGTPFFYLGDTHWLFVHERFDTANVAGVPSQFKYTVDKRTAQGFTVFQSGAIHIPHGGTHAGPSEEAHADLTNGFTEADLPGFTNIDRKFAYIADHGLVHANSMITWAHEPEGNAVFTAAYMARLGRYWAARYGAYPVLWTVAQEIDPNMYGLYEPTTIGPWYAGAQAVADNDAYAQPLGAHMQSIGYGINHPADSWWGGKPYHKWWPMQLQDNLSMDAWQASVKEFWQNLPAKPIVLYESPYDGFWTDNKGARSAGYRAFQSGMCGYGYGANGIWNDLYAIDDYGTDYEMPGRYLNWYDGANLPTGGQMTHLADFYKALAWWNLAPRFDDTTWGAFTDPDRSLLSSDGNTTYVVYFFGDGNATGTLKGMATGIPYEASWYNPRSGVATSLGGITPSAGQWTVSVRPTSDDWVLLVKQNPSATVLSPGNGVTVSPSVSQLSWTADGSPPNLSYQVYFGTAAMYDIEQAHGNLARLTPQGGTASRSVALPSALPPGTYYWMLTVADPATGTSTSYTSSFSVAALSIPVDNGNFETMGTSSEAGWARIASVWNPVAANPYQQNNLVPTLGAHFTATSAGGGGWYALLNGNTGSIRQDLHTTVNAGDTLSVTFHGGRAKAGSSTAAGGVFNATFLIGSTPYSMQVNTTALSNNRWQTFTLTKTVANSGNLSLEFSAVSGDPWLDNIGNVALTPPPVLSVSMTAPLDGGLIPTGVPITASATVANGTGPFIVTYDISGPDGTTAAAGTSGTAPYAVDLGPLAPGIYQIGATVTDSGAPPETAISVPQTFTVSSTTIAGVQNGSFETMGTSSGEGWAHIAPVWNPVAANPYQQNNLVPTLGAHFTATSAGGGGWYAVLNGNTGSIRQDLHTTVNAGDTLSVTFHGGRAKAGLSTAAGGVFNATFLIGSTPYSMQVNTTALSNNTWQAFTLTKTVANSGNLSLEFSAVSGDPWLDNIGNVTITPATPYTRWLLAHGGVPSGMTGFDDDPDGDGVPNGLVWILGGSDPLANSCGLLPVATANADGTLTLVFDCLKRADWGTATLAVEYGNNLGAWISTTVPDSTATVNGVNFIITGTGPLHVTAIIPKIHPADAKLYGRLKAMMP